MEILHLPLCDLKNGENTHISAATHPRILNLAHKSSIGVGIVSFQDGRHGSKVAAMDPIQDGVQAS